MNRGKLGTLIFLNLFFVIGAIFLHTRSTSFSTRIHFFDMKVQSSSEKSSDESVASLAIVQEFLKHKLSENGPWLSVKKPEEILGEFEIYRDELNLDRSCKFSYQSSVESDGLFFDIQCDKQGIASQLFDVLFWSLLKKDMGQLGKSWQSEERLKDFYYLNHLSPVSLSSDKRVALPRYSSIFEDQLDRISALSFAIYLLLSLGLINLFCFKIFNLIPRGSFSIE